MPEPTPTVSVVIPAYNRSATIRPAIESVLRQTWTDFELIVVDDGSTDSTVEAIHAIADPRIRILATPRNLGASGARNLGICEARAPWIAFQDSDDEWLPRKLEKQMARLLAPGANYVAAYCGMVILGGPDEWPARHRVEYIPRPRWPVEALEGAILPTVLRASLISTQTLIVRRDRLLEIGGFDEEIRILVDWECVIRLAQIGSFAFVDEPLVLQSFSLNSLTRDAANRPTTRMRIVEKHRAVFERHPSALAFRFHEHAGSLRQTGDLPGARAYLRKACALAPRQWRYWAMLAYLSLLAPLGQWGWKGQGPPAEAGTESVPRRQTTPKGQR
jgi:glycosyltransferase involved in cell wall biosynthesis